MGKANTAVNTWLSDNRRFADLFNGTVFGGKQVILPEDLDGLDRETDIIIPGKDNTSRDLQRYRDIVKQWKKGPFFAVLACESQDKIHYAMPVRNMLYDGLSYTEQIRTVWKEDEYRRSNPADGQASHPRLTSEEYFSRFRKTDLIFPVITLVFYYDLKKWDGAVELYDMFHFDSRTDTEAEIFNLLRTYLPNYRINLIDAGNMENINRFHTDLQQIFGVLQYRGKKEELRSYMLENRDYFGQVDVETYHALQSFLHSEKIMKEVEVSQGKERIDMCQALEDIYADGVKDGEKTGRTQEKLAIIVKMMQDNLPVSTIKKYTDATDEEIENAKTAVLH